MPIKMDAKVVFDSLMKLEIKLEKAVKNKALEKSVNYAVSDIANDLAKRVRANLKKYGPHKGGKWSYYRYKPFWTPSPPGEPPARITSALLNSVKVNQSGTQFTDAGMIRRGGGQPFTLRLGQSGYRAKTYYVEVGSDVPYGYWQEFGTSTIPARPFMMPAYKDLRDNSDWLGHMGDAVAGAVKATTGFNLAWRGTPVYQGSLRERHNEQQKFRAAQKRIAAGTQTTGPRQRQQRQIVHRAKQDFSSQWSPQKIAETLNDYFSDGE